MKIQELAIIFIIIILPISLVLSVYTQNQVQTINTQTLYDNRLTSATYDAMRAYQLNAANSTTSDMSNSKTRDIEASVSAFRNSIMTAFELNGFTANELNSYIPALVYTMYDGLYIYSPYSNIAEVNTDANADEEVKIKTEGQKEYGLKPYISYSCRYKTTSIDVVITYSLDNHIAVKGMIGREYVNKEGYLIDGIECSINPDEEIKINDEIENAIIKYNGIEIGTESLKEYLPLSIDKNAAYPYAKINGTKYYLIHDKEGDQIVYVSNGFFRTQCKSTDSDKTAFNAYKNIIENNYMAKEYYYEAYKFTDWFKNSGLSALTYGDAWDEVLVKNSDGSGAEQEYREIWPENSTPIFQFNSSSDIKDIKNNIENETSTFNQHRLAVIRYKIENNLAIAISNYNEYSGVKNVFQMPELKEDEWDQIIHNISLISFLQGLPIGEKTYNGYTLVTNSESEEVVLEGNIFMLGESANGEKVYYRIGDVELEKENGGTATLNAGNYGDISSAGRLNLDFKRRYVTDTSQTQTYYYYQMRNFKASYNSVVMQDKVTTFDDIYKYINGNEVSKDYKIAFYTALGRERQGSSAVDMISILIKRQKNKQQLETGG